MSELIKNTSTSLSSIDLKGNSSSEQSSKTEALTNKKRKIEQQPHVSAMEISSDIKSLIDRREELALSKELMRVPSDEKKKTSYKNQKVEWAEELSIKREGTYTGYVTSSSQRHGSAGTMRYRSEDVYSGEWNLDKKEGEGIFRWSNGDIYRGQFYQDLPEGKGKCEYCNGSVYEGEWHQGQWHGFGVYKTAFYTFEGTFYQGGRDGKGTVKWHDGGYIEGIWKDHMPHGVFHYLSKSGVKYRQVYQHGKLIKEEKVPSEDDFITLEDMLSYLEDPEENREQMEEIVKKINSLEMEYKELFLSSVKAALAQKERHIKHEMKHVDATKELLSSLSDNSQISEKELEKLLDDYLSVWRKSNK